MEEEKKEEEKEGKKKPAAKSSGAVPAEPAPEKSSESHVKKHTKGGDDAPAKGEKKSKKDKE
jgi:hypothetical protein